MNVLRQSRRVGVVTTAYPEAPESASGAFRGQVLLQADRCVGDGSCARVCPSSAIVVEGTPGEGWIWELDDARCVFCGLCADACPTDALLISSEFELAVRAREDLKTRIAFAPLGMPAANEKDSR